MKNERTWHNNTNAQKIFAWAATDTGIQIFNCGKTDTYDISWKIFFLVLAKAQALANTNNGRAIAGTCQDNPTPGSVGEWVQANLSNYITPRHLSFLGPIYGSMELVKRQTDGNSIIWEVL